MFPQIPWAYLWSLPWILYWVDCLSPLCLVLLGFCLVLSFEISSSASSFWLILCFYFYGLLIGRLATFPNLGEVALWRRCPWGPAVHSPLVIRAIFSKTVPMWAAWTFLLWQGDNCGQAGRWGWAQVCPGACDSLLVGRIGYPLGLACCLTF